MTTPLLNVYYEDNKRLWQ